MRAKAEWIFSSSAVSSLRPVPLTISPTRRWYGSVRNMTLISSPGPTESKSAPPASGYPLVTDSSMDMPKGNYQKVLLADFDIWGAAQLCGLHRDDVQKLVLWKLAAPSSNPHPGRGGPARARKFGPADIQRLRVIAPLYQAGMPPRYIRRVLALLDEHNISLPRDGVLVVNGDAAMLLTRQMQTFDVLRGFQGAFYLFLDVRPPGAAPERVERKAKVSRVGNLPRLALRPIPTRRAGRP